MCGIAAILRASSGETLSRIRAMTDLVRHRGPDGEGFAIIGQETRGFGGPDTPSNLFGANLPYAPERTFVIAPTSHSALGHRRLSIVDLSLAGHQPMCDSQKRYWITYNGEIYNYVELRRELESLGHQFLSQTDTEVILAAYAQWGESCLNRFNGMWAFVLVDLQNQTAFVARDRFGVKPLYYWVLPEGGIAIASEIKQFTALPSWRAEANVPRCYDFLVRALFDHTDETLFAGVRQLPGGTAFTYSLGTAAAGPLIRRWYELPRARTSFELPWATEKVRELLTDSVRLRLRADVKVGSCLSGGLDSSSIVCLVNRLLREIGKQELQETVSSCFDIARFDERQFIEAVGAHTRIKTHYVFPDYRALFSTLPSIAWHQDEPFGSTSIFAQWNVFAEARRHGLTVMLDGQGADEQLAGYHGFFAAWFTQLWKGFRWVTWVREVRAWRRRHEYPYRMAPMLMADQMLPPTLRRWALKIIGRPLNPSWLQRSFLEKASSRFSDPERSSPGLRGSVYNMSRAKLMLTSLPMLLHYEDRDSMAHSIEARVPFLDYRLVEFILSLPDALKVNGGETKYVLRAAMDGILPDAVRRRQDKLGFVTPEEVWIRELATEQFAARLNQAAEQIPQVFNRESLTSLFNSFLKSARPFDYTLWRIISFAAWAEVFRVKVD